MSFTRILLLTCSLVAGQLLSLKSYAASPKPAVPPNLKSLNIRQICAAPNVRYMLARSIIDNYKMSPKMFDWEDNGISDPRRLVLEKVCEGHLTPAQQNKCFGDKPQTGANDIPVPSADYLLQSQMVQDVNAFFRSLPDANGDISVGDDKASIQFKKAGSPSALEVKRQPLLGLDGGYSTAAAVFSEAPTFYDVSCRISPEKPNKPAVGAGRPTSGSDTALAGSGAISTETLSDRFRLRGKTDDLWIGRDADGFSSLSGSSFSLSKDQIAAKTNLDAHLVLGYALPAWQSGGVVLNSIPYLKYDRDYIDGVKPTSTNNVNNIAFGVQQRLTFPVTESFYSAVIFQPQFVDSLRTGAQVVSLRLAYEPEPLVPYLGFIAQTPIPDLWGTAYLRGVTNYYEVTKPANDGSLNAKMNFWHAGFQAGGVLVFKDGALNGLSFPVDYTYLYGISGPYKSVELLQLAATYTLPKTKYVTVGLSYTSGRNLDTFELQKIYKATLGLKY